ncbi:MAG: family 43 glycosylhydrolase, partial [Bacteroidales bacterium]|nr:family 43 glycosylhydrolase [Bacteroidales bacterium]
MKKQLLTLFSSLLLFAAASANEIGIYSNPVINQDFPDPTVMRAQDGAFYAARTGGWTSIFKSYNLSDWFYVREAYSDAEQVPSGNRYGLPGDTWACDLNYINGKYVLYFAVSEWGGTWTCGIGCSWSENPAGPYHDTKKLFNSKEIGVENSIDPCYYEDNGKKYLFWGSFCGIYAIELSDDGLSIKPNASKVKITGASWSASIEGTMIHKHGGYYYLIGSKGSCCEGLKSTYQLVVARSTNVLGPYTNMNGGSALNNNFTTLLSGNSRVKGPGHCSEIITDDKGQDWILYHGYDVNNADAGRKTYLDPVYWKDGWPYIAADDTPSKGGAKPYIKQPGNTLNEKWNFSEQRNTQTQKGWDASKVRNFCYNDGKLYCVYDHSAIKVINAQTGEDLGNLNETDICTGGTLKFCDVKCFNGHIVACNLANASKGEEFRLYCWDNDQENPYLLYSTTDLNGAARLGDCLEIAPDSDWDTNLWLCLANQNGTTTNVIEFNRNAEGWHKYVYPVTTDKTTQFVTGATARAYPNGGVWWIDGINCEPTFFGRENGVLYKKLSFSTGETWGSCHHEFWFRGQKYAANLKFNDRTTGDSNSTFKGGRMRLIIDDSGTYSSASWVCEYPTDGLGSTTKNSNGTGDVAINTDGNNYIEAWVCSTNQGMAYFTYGTPPTQSPSPILPAGPSIQASGKSIELTTTAYTPVSKTVKITGNYLEGDINLALSGANADLFSLSSTSIAQSAGSADITVTYSPTAAGSHSATLTATSANATAVTVSLTGTASAKMDFDDNVTMLTEGWLFSSAKGNAADASWLSLAAPLTRDIAYKDGKLYVAKSNSSEFGITVVNATTGAKISDLNVSGISGGTYPIGGLNVIGGKLIASCAAAANHNLKVYMWNDDSSAPTTIL